MGTLHVFCDKNNFNSNQFDNSIMSGIFYKIFSIILAISVIWCEVIKTNTTKTTIEQMTTVKPAKLNVQGSTLCQKCSCILKPNIHELNCDASLKKDWFTNDDWNTLQNGDLDFDKILLEHNNFTNVQVFKSLPVKNLSLAFNQIVKLEAGFLQFLFKLEVLNLSQNNLTSKNLSPDVFRGNYSEKSYLPLTAMRELNLAYNNLHTLDPDLFEHFPNLEKLNLAGNVFHVIDHLSETAISGISTLKILDMSDMELIELPSNFLHSPRNLEKIILSDNLFKKIPDSLKLAVNLKMLILDSNPINNLEGENIFPEMKNLEYLSISYLPHLTKIGNGSLSNLQNLKTLIASNNPKLSIIDSDAFRRPTVMKDIFDYPFVENLFLENNNLSFLNRTLLLRWDKLQSIDLRYNKWHCDCSNSWLIHTLMPRINIISPTLSKDVKCTTPEPWKSISLIDLSTEEKVFKCNDKKNIENESHFSTGFIIGIFFGIPMTLVIFFAYRKFFINGRNSANSSYNRANFNEDFHI